MGSLQQDRELLLDQLFQQYDVKLTDELNCYQLQAIHADMRLGGISIPQVEAAIAYTCIGAGCERGELFDVLQEMDRRYYLIQDLRWEFTMLDYFKTDTVTEEAAMWLMQAVHDNRFSKRKWEKFVRGRAVPGSGVSFAEIEVMLCDIPNLVDVLDEELEKQREREERERKEKELEKRLNVEREKIKKRREEERKRKEEEDKRLKEDADQRRREEEAERLQNQMDKEEAEKRERELEEEEERGRKEAEERERRLREEREEEEKAKQQELQEMQRLREMQDRAATEQEEQRMREQEEAKADEEVLNQAVTDEKDAAEKLVEARKKVQTAKDARSKKEFEAEENKQKIRHKSAKVKRIRYHLKVSYKKRNKETLPRAVRDFADAKLPDDEFDLEKAERILKEWKAKDGLKNAMENRLLKELEVAVSFVKKNGLEPQLARDMIEANRILFQLRRLERIRAEILELKQSTVAEIRSYSKPPAMVHTVMISTFLLHGHKEKQTKDWKTVQALVGKTGKEGLKRRCVECEPAKLEPEAAKRAKALLSAFELDDVREVSAGAATFYNWSRTMIEEFEAKFEAEGHHLDEVKSAGLKKRRKSTASSVGQ